MAEYIDRCDSCIHDEVCYLWDKAECQDAQCYSQLLDGSCGCYRNKNDVAPVVHAHWIDTGSGQECSSCKEIQYGYDNGRRYCQNCGAKMMEGNNANE